MVPVVLAAGFLGMLLVLLAFALEEFVPQSKHESVAYNALNVVGASFLSWYSWWLHSIPFLLLNSVWLVVGIVKVCFLVLASRQHRRVRR